MKYLQKLNECFGSIKVSGKGGKSFLLEDAIARVVALARATAKRGNKTMIIGNGGSSAIASHMAIDLLKNAKVPALVFNDPGSLTCLANDLGYDAVFEKPIEMLSRKGDLLIAISSSGRSANIVKAVKMAKKKQAIIVTLSGFSSSNPLKKMGAINFYVPSSSYGFVELTHSVICHWIVDSAMCKGLHG